MTATEPRLGTLRLSATIAGRKVDRREDHKEANTEEDGPHDVEERRAENRREQCPCHVGDHGLAAYPKSDEEQFSHRPFVWAQTRFQCPNPPESL
jgi:hypothetical protein